MYSQLLASARWQRVLNAGARPQRLLFVSTGTKDPKVSVVLYLQKLIAPLATNTMPEATLQAFAAHGEVEFELYPDSGSSAEMLRQFVRSGVDLDGLAEHLQEQGAASFVSAWNDLLSVTAAKLPAAVKELS